MFLIMKRGLVITSALLTIGLFVQSDIGLDVQVEDPQKAQENKSLIYKVNQDNYELFHDVLPVKTDSYFHRIASSSEIINKYILKQAHEQSMRKFGRTISAKIGDPFETTILPRLNNVVKETTNTLSEDDWTQLKVTNAPAGGFGEKILHLYNEKTDEDILRFHVRRDLRPNHGYEFNFHYHTYLDEYEGHHDLGTIYWGKDMPQQWNGVNRI